MVERTVDLWEHLPSFLKNFRELDKLLEAETPEFQLLVENELKLLNNLFILTADEEGLKRFEALLHLYPAEDDTLETRRNNVLTKWYTKDIYTMKTLRNRLEMLQGNSNIDLIWDDVDKLLLHVITRLESKGQVDTLVGILEGMLPMNIAYQSENRLEITENIDMSFAMGLSMTGTLFNTNDIVGVYPVDIPANVGARISITGTLFMTNDLIGTYGNNIPLNVGSGVTMTETHFITD